jgi:hypothetical protein
MCENVETTSFANSASVEGAISIDGVSLATAAPSGGYQPLVYLQLLRQLGVSRPTCLPEDHRPGGQALGGRYPKILDAIYEQLGTYERETGQAAWDLAPQLIEDERFLTELVELVKAIPITDEIASGAGN